jgi:hypothetical protein
MHLSLYNTSVSLLYKTAYCLLMLQKEFLQVSSSVINFTSIAHGLLCKSKGTVWVLDLLIRAYGSARARSGIVFSVVPYLCT